MTLQEHLREEALRLMQDHPDETPLGLTQIAERIVEQVTWRALNAKNPENRLRALVHIGALLDAARKTLGEEEYETMLYEISFCLPGPEECVKLWKAWRE